MHGTMVAMSANAAPMAWKGLAAGLTIGAIILAKTRSMPLWTRLQVALMMGLLSDLLITIIIMVGEAYDHGSQAFAHEALTLVPTAAIGIPALLAIMARNRRQARLERHDAMIHVPIGTGEDPIFSQMAKAAEEAGPSDLTNALYALRRVIRELMDVDLTDQEVDDLDQISDGISKKLADYPRLRSQASDKKAVDRAMLMAVSEASGAMMPIASDRIKRRTVLLGTRSKMRSVGGLFVAFLLSMWVPFNIMSFSFHPSAQDAWKPVLSLATIAVIGWLTDNAARTMGGSRRRGAWLPGLLLLDLLMSCTSSKTLTIMAIFISIGSSVIAIYVFSTMFKKRAVANGTAQVR